MWQSFLYSVRYLLYVHLTALGMMTLLRVCFFWAVSDQLTEDVRGNWGLTLTAFLRGLWFDNVVACYLLMLPLVILSVLAIIGKGTRKAIRPIGIFLGTMYTLVFMATTANIPYFAYFTKIINSSIWNWAEYGGTTLGMIFGEPSYYLYITAFFLFTAVFCLLLKRYGHQFRKSMPGHEPAQDFNSSECDKANHATLWERFARPVVPRIAIALSAALLIALCTFGIRGRMGYNPIKISAAYFCNNPVLNQLGVNPMFCLMQSTIDDLRPENRKLHLMDNAAAVQKARQLLGRSGIDGISPLARKVVPEGEPTGRNVVIVLMESMSANLTGIQARTRLTPNLDSLARESLFFTNFYSSGNHTNHGIYSTLYSFPAILGRNAMKGTSIPTYDGLPTVLKEAGYQTLFFMTHESQYDNMNAFLRTNGYDEIYAAEDYPKDKIVSYWGIQDDYLFTYAIPVLRKAAQKGKPFLATLLTISNHPPYIVPQWFPQKSTSREYGIVEYCDWSIGQFMQAVAHEPWYENTVFVFVGDHGKIVGKADCEVPTSFNHVPFFLHGKGIEPGTNTNWAGHVDIAPTLLGMLRIPYTQNNFGIDLFREKRPCIFYSADKTVVARNDRHLYVYNPTAETEFFYQLDPVPAGALPPVPQPTECTPDHLSLRDYCFSMLQATEALVDKGMTRDH